MDPVKKRVVFKYPDEIIFTGDMIQGPNVDYQMVADGSMFVEPLGDWINPAEELSFITNDEELKIAPTGDIEILEPASDDDE